MNRQIALFSLMIVLTCAPAWGQTIKIDINCTMQSGGAEESALKKFKELLENRTSGRITVAIMMSGQLGDERAVLELMKLGRTQMSLSGGIFLNMFAKEFDPISIPFYMEHWEMVNRYFEGPLGRRIQQAAAEKGGLTLMAVQKRSPRQMTSNRKITRPEDIRGLKMRLPEVPVWIDVWQEIGALPIIIPATDIFQAMKTRQVDAHENSLISPYSRKLWEVQKYIILTSHIYFPWHWVASQTWFEGLSRQDQNLIRDAVTEARNYGEKIEDVGEKFLLEELQKAGMEIIVPDVKAIRQAAMPAIHRAVHELSPEAIAEIERLKSALKHKFK